MVLLDKLVIFLTSKHIGLDSCKNNYYVSLDKDYLGRCRRFVIYNGVPDPSKIPPLWNAWLRYAIQDFPSYNNSYEWQTPFVCNLTGTSMSYKPSNTASSNYVAWRPDE